MVLKKISKFGAPDPVSPPKKPFGFTLICVTAAIPLYFWYLFYLLGSSYKEII